MSCRSGIMMIIAKETRSRLSWMNSLISIAQVRRQKKRCRASCGAWLPGALIEPGIVIGNRVSLIIVFGLAHEVDEGILERRRRPDPGQARPVVVGCDRRLERGFAAPRHV